MKLKLNERIRSLRRASGRTQEELAEILGVSPQAVSRWESAAGYPDTETLPRLANCFGVSPANREPLPEAAMQANITASAPLRLSRR